MVFARCCHFVCPRVSTPSGISISSAVLAWHTVIISIHTDTDQLRPHYISTFGLTVLRAKWLVPPQVRKFSACALVINELPVASIRTLKGKLTPQKQRVNLLIVHCGKIY